MMDAVLALRRVIQARLAGDAELVALLGGPRIHDEPPRAASGPYVLHGEVEARDASSQGVEACEQEIELVVWAGQPGATGQALAVASRVGRALHEAALTPQGHRLISLVWTGLRLGRDEKTGLSRAAVKLRALTERL